MTDTNSSLVSFDAEKAVSAARSVAGDGLNLCVEYTTEEFYVRYADNPVVSRYGDREEMTRHFAEVHSYVHVDFMEQDLFEDLFRAGSVQSFVTYMDEVAFVRVLADHEGLFVTVRADAPVSELVAAVESVVQTE